MVKIAVLEVEGVTISGQLYLPAGKTPYPTVCVCHGIPTQFPDPGNSGYALLVERVCGEGFSVFIFNFRGTGPSGGNLDILGWTRDLGAVIDYLCALPEVDKSHLSLLGFSAGAAVSIYVASSDNRVSCVAACASPAEFDFVNEVNDPQPVVDHFRNLGAIRDENFPPSVEEWFNGFRLVRPIEYVAGISPRPLLLVHGGQDEMVAASHACRLYDRAGEPKQIVILDDAGHGLRDDDSAMTVVIDWLKARGRGS